jgi:hypothetical protein
MMREGHAMFRHAGANAAHSTRPFAAGRLIARMRDWFAASTPLASAGGRVPAPYAPRAVESVVQLAARSAKPRPEIAQPADASDVSRQMNRGRDGTVVLLPLNGRRLLAQLAQDLRADFDTAAEDDDPLHFTLTPGPEQRLWIDSTAHVDVRDDLLPYRVVLGDALTTRIILETSDFAEVRKFVCQYLLLTRTGSAGSAT